MRKILHISIFFAFGFLMMQTHLFSQHISTAVMEVRAEIIAGSEFSRSDATEVITFGNVDDAQINYGEFLLFIPTGVEVITSASDRVMMEGLSGSWVLNSEMAQNYDENGKMTIRFFTLDTGENRSGLYRGTQTATVIYL